MNDIFYNILIIDDNPAIHDDLKKIFMPEKSKGLSDLEKTEQLLFNEEKNDQPEKKESSFEIRIDSAFQGEEGIALLKEKSAQGVKYSIAFVDVRMPPGWDGIKTTMAIWEIDPDIQVIICSAYSDYNWEDISGFLGETDKLLIIKKPFDVIEARQAVTALLKKWQLINTISARVQHLREVVDNKSSELENYLSLIKTTLSSTTDGIVIFNKEGHVLDCNDHFLQLWGLDKAIVQDSNFNTILDNMLTQLSNSEKLQAITSADNITSEQSFSVRLLFNKGTILECLSKPQYMNNMMVARIWCFQDITAYLNLQENLINSEKMAMVGMLATGIAHELNQPLSIIRTNIQSLEFMLDKDLSTTDLSDIIASVNRQMERTADIISHMRNLAKTGSTSAVKLDIEKSIDMVLTSFTNQEKVPRVECQIEKALPPFYMDLQQFNQLFNNLLSNAKYAVETKQATSTKSYQPKITLHVNYDKEQQQFMIKVIDNGVGMTKEILDHCFDPFFTTKPVGGGQGLGLTIIYSIAKNMQGNVEIQSIPEQGTTVCITLPQT